jgi:hypothetical protein
VCPIKNRTVKNSLSCVLPSAHGEEYSCAPASNARQTPPSRPHLIPPPPLSQCASGWPHPGPATTSHRPPPGRSIISRATPTTHGLSLLPPLSLAPSLEPSSFSTPAWTITRGPPERRRLRASPQSLLAHRQQRRLPALPTAEVGAASWCLPMA